MKPEEQIKALAELDGFEDFDLLKKQTGDITRFLHGAKRSENKWTQVANYCTSYDAIIPLIQKQNHVVVMELGKWIQQECGTRYPYDATPAQLCEALLRATGKWVVIDKEPTYDECERFDHHDDDRSSI